MPSFQQRRRALIKSYRDETKPERQAGQALEVAAKQCGCQVRYVDVAPVHAYGGAHVAKPSQPGEVLTLTRGERTLPLDTADVERFVTVQNVYRPWEHRLGYVHVPTQELHEV